MTFVRWLRRLRATRLDSYPSSSMTRCTRCDVACATPYRPLITFDTVATDTPAVRATSWMFTRWQSGRAVQVGHAGHATAVNRYR